MCAGIRAGPDPYDQDRVQAVRSPPPARRSGSGHPRSPPPAPPRHPMKSATLQTEGRMRTCPSTLRRTSGASGNDSASPNKSSASCSDAAPRPSHPGNPATATPAAPPEPPSPNSPDAARHPKDATAQEPPTPASTNGPTAGSSPDTPTAPKPHKPSPPHAQEPAPPPSNTASSPHSEANNTPPTNTNGPPTTNYHDIVETTNETHLHQHPPMDQHQRKTLIARAAVKHLGWGQQQMRKSPYELSFYQGTFN